MTKVYLKMDQTPLPWRGWGRVYPPLTPPREGTKNKTTCENY